MNYAVAWSLDVCNSLAAVWLQSANRNSVTKAQETIDRRLSSDPVTHSKPVSEGLYAIEANPLRVIFELDEDTRTVEVVGISLLP